MIHGGAEARLKTKTSVEISRGIESLFGTRDENVRLLENRPERQHTVAGRQPGNRRGRGRRGPRREHPRGLRGAGQAGPLLLQRRSELLPARGDRGPRGLAARPGLERQAAQLRQEARCAQGRQPAPLPGGHRAQRPGLRHRPGGHRQDLPGGGHGRLRAPGQAGQPHHPDPAGGGGRRAAGLPSRHASGEGRPLPAPPLRRPLRHARRGQGGQAAGADRRSRSRRWPSCAAAP